MTQRWTIPMAAVLLASTSIPVFAATLRVPRDHATIQEAVNAASDGDKIVVAPGVYTEEVVIDGKNDLRLIGRRVIWDGGTDGNQLVASGDNLTIQGILFRHGQVQVAVFGDGTVVNRCRSTGAAMHFVLVQSQSGEEAAGATVERCRIEDSLGPAVKLYAHDARVAFCRFETMNVAAVLASGDDAVIERCFVRGSHVHGVIVEGQRATIDRNRINNARIKGISVHGGEAEIVNNRVFRGCAVAGIELQHGYRTDFSGNGPYFDGGRIESNQVLAVKGSGIRSHFASTTSIVRNLLRDGGAFGVACSTHQARIEDNMIQGYGAIGVLILADDGSVIDNDVRRSGYGCDSAFLVQGDRNELDDNAVFDFGGDGFWVLGDDNVLTDNAATQCTEDGFDVEGGDANRLTGCAARSCGAEGLDNSGSNTEVPSGTYLGNLIDVVNDGTFTTLGASFSTGGDAVPPQIDCPSDQRQEFRIQTIVGVSRPTFDSRGSRGEPDFERDLDVVTLPGLTIPD